MKTILEIHTGSCCVGRIWPHRHSAADQKFVSIGTGGVTGVYYPTGGAICRLVNKDRKDTRHPLLGGIHRRIGLQCQHGSRWRA